MDSKGPKMFLGYQDYKIRNYVQQFLYFSHQILFNICFSKNFNKYILVISKNHNYCYQTVPS